ncbi:MAG: ATP-binding cassette domain-containing protein, partial [Candidatus Tectomicrobia bacterium]|nr:ATP-binding cassette domain-containing protein [Candidatus Tectomicrobia bacterium]
QSLKTGGCTIILISHKLHEVMALSDRITVLRAGKVVGLFQTDRVVKEELTAPMMGSNKTPQFDQKGLKDLNESSILCPSEKKHPLLQLLDITATTYQGGCGLRDIQFSLYPGEILGIAGIDGNGQRELAEIVAGVSKAAKGSINIHGKRIKNPRPKQMIKAGVAFIPQDRYVSGAIGDFSLEENLLLPVHREYPFSSFGLLRKESMSNFAKSCLEEFGIKAPNVEFKAKALSGGNLQKLVLARELSRNPSIIVACYPTRGLDLSARDYLWFKLKQEKEKGKGILLITADSDEIFTLCDRVGILYAGKLIGPMATKEITPQILGLYMSGG